MLLNIVNLVGFDVGWFASVMGAAHGLWWLGPVTVVGLVALHWPLIERRRALLALLPASAAVGYAFDSTLALGGWVVLDGPAAVGGPSPVWMVMMWPNFALTLHGVLRWMRTRYLVGAAFGLVGGPMAYAAGAALGALQLGGDRWEALAAVGVAWALATPALLAIDRLTARLEPPREKGDATAAQRVAASEQEAHA